MSQTAYRRKAIALLAIGICAGSAAVAQIEAGRDKALGPVYVVQNDQVRFPGWDDLPSRTRPRVTLQPADFALKQNIKGGTVPFKSGTYRTEALVAPTTATSLVIKARGNPEEDIFPKVEISLIPGDTQPAAKAQSSSRLYRGFIQSVSMTDLTVAVPPEWRGRSIRLQFDMLNPSAINGPRFFALQKLVWQ